MPEISEPIFLVAVMKNTKIMSVKHSLFVFIVLFLSPLAFYSVCVTLHS